MSVKYIVKEGRSVLGSRGVKGPGEEITIKDCRGDQEAFDKLLNPPGKKESPLEKIGSEELDKIRAEKQAELDEAAKEAEAKSKKKGKK
jgi:hypothetical protein